MHIVECVYENILGVRTVLDASQKHLQVMHNLNHLDVKIIPFSVEGITVTPYESGIGEKYQLHYPPLGLKSTAT